MVPFLDKLARHIYENYGDGTGELCIVLPNRRAGLFLKKYLAGHYAKTIWAPQVFSVEDFIFSLSGLELIDPLDLIFELYEVHKKIAGRDHQEIDRFMDWGRILLSDFNEIDLYLADPEKVFGILSEAKAIERWNLGNGPLTDTEQQYLVFYQSLYQYYKLLSKGLLEKKQVYQGLAYKILADNIENKLDGISWHRVIFAGLNAFSKAEEKIITTLLDSDKADIFWDADEYYLNDPVMEAGKFISGYFKRWRLKDKKWVEQTYKNEDKKITITGVAKNIGQAKFTAQILADSEDPELQPDNTAIVLANEKLLIPLLNSIPESIQEFNITMGYPLKLTALFQLFKYILSLQEKAGLTNKTGKKNPSFYVKDILDILDHPYLQQWGHKNEKSPELGLPRITGNIRAANKVFYSAKELDAKFNSLGNGLYDLLKITFTVWEQAVTAISYMTVILEKLRDHFISLNAEDKGRSQLDIEYVFQFARIINKLSSLLTQYGSVDKIKTLKNLFIQIAETSTIPFYGEPLKGIQIMGMLETRALDFRNIILLSANENILPAGKTVNSFIPFDIKLDFELPTFAEKDAVYAYHFYRMFQRSTNINIVYNTEPDEFGSGEKSRFLTQLTYELPRYNTRIKPKEQLLTVPPETGKASAEIVIEKTGDVLAAVRKKAGDGFSPSSLSTYVNCKLQFYFSHIARLTETEEVEETIDAATLGNVIHHVLHRLYKPFIDKRVVVTDLKGFKEKIRQYSLQSFQEIYKDGDVSQGKNLLILNLAMLFISRFIDQEIHLLSENGKVLIIKMLEDTMDTRIEIVNEEGEKMQVCLKGKIDRIDMLDNTIRIIDYKTGRIAKNDVSIKSWDDLISDTKYSKALQLLIYGYISGARKTFPGYPVQSGIISLRSLSLGYLPVITPEGNNIEEIMPQFEAILKELLVEVLDANTPFTQTDKIENCEYCPYRPVCIR